MGKRRPKPPPVIPPALPPTGTVYGSAFNMDTKDNFRIGGSGLARMSHRFRASTTSPLLSVRWCQRGGASGYSGGTGGSYRITVQTDSGGAPSGAVLAATSYTPNWPGGDWAPFEMQTFPVPATLTQGQLYHVVFENVDPAPTRNYISANNAYVYDRVYMPRQPAFSNDLAVIYDTGSGWKEQPDTPIVDLTYANGVHDGQAYIQAMAPQAGYISGVKMVRERFTVSGGDRTAQSVSVRLLRLAGSGSNPLIFRLETGAGAEIESVSVLVSSVVVGTLGDCSCGDWVTARFLQSHVLANGQTYNLRLSTGFGVTYACVPIREGTDSGLLSYAFRDGSGQRTTDGVTWADLYPWSPVDLQFYFVT
ncbi:MAG: hypothetical protein V2A79_03755 [Planctomycetota bacterium]